MERKTGIALVVLLISAIMFGIAQVPAGAVGGSLDIELTHAWTTGIISDSFGSSGIVVDDINNDGLVEILGCSRSAFALKHSQSGTYDPIWYSQDLDCSSIAIGDRDGNGYLEIYVGTGTHEIVIFDSANFAEIGRISIPGNFPRDVDTGDVDGDGQLEIVVATEDATHVYDAQTLNHEWEAGAYGGTRLETGDIDGDGKVEIVVNNPSIQAYVLDASTKSLEWAYSGGFGPSFSLGDVDNDQVDEIAYVEEWNKAYVLEGDTQTVKWSLDNLGDLNEVHIADVSGNSAGEVLIGNGQWGEVTGYNGQNGGFLWAIDNPEHGVFGLAAGDTDDDGTTEVVFGAGLSSTGKDAMIVGDWTTGQPEYISPDLDGSLLVAAADLDLDGDVEVVMATYSTTSGYEGGTLQIFDGETHELEWEQLVATSFYDLSRLRIGQLDGDGALEIVVGGNNWYDTRLTVYDGITHAMEWQSAALGSNHPVELLVGNVDADPIEEIILAISGTAGRVLVFNGASPVIQWDSGNLGYIHDIALGDSDGDGVKELAVLLETGIKTFSTSGWTLELSLANPVARRIGSVPGNNGSPGRLFVYSASEGKLLGLNGLTGAQEVSWPVPTLESEEIIVMDLDLDGDVEIGLLGRRAGSGMSYLDIFSSPNANTFWLEHTELGYWGTINSLAAGDLDGNGDQELVLGSTALIQVRDMATSPLSISQIYVPAAMSCHLLYLDDFSNPNSGWPVVNTENTLYEYRNGEYRVLVRNPFGLAGAYPGPSFSNYQVSTNVRRVTAEPGTYGLLFGQVTGWSGFYTFEIDANQHYEIWRFDGSWDLLKQGSSSALKAGSATNTIAIQRNGSSIKAFANGQWLATVSDSKFTGLRHVGVWVTSGDGEDLDIRYDNYRVEPIACGWDADAPLGSEDPGTPEMDLAGVQDWIDQAVRQRKP